MAELNIKEGLPIDRGGGGGKKKFKLNKKTIIIFGGLAIVAYFGISLLFRKSDNTASQAESVAGGTALYDDGMPTNSADVAAQLQNYNDMLSTDVNSQMSAFESYVDANNQSVFNDMSGILTQTSQDYQDKLDAVLADKEEMLTSNKEQYDALAQRLVDQSAASDKALKAAQDKAQADLNKSNKTNEDAMKLLASKTQKEVDAAKKDAETARKKAAEAVKQAAKSPVKTPAKTPAKSNTAKTSSIINGVKGNTKTVSVVDYLKSAGVNSSIDNRAKLAKAAGISNYKGTASQNTKLLSTLKKNANKKK